MFFLVLSSVEARRRERKEERGENDFDGSVVRKHGLLRR
jgi:hypothetical protein